MCRLRSLRWGEDKYNICDGYIQQTLIEMSPLHTGVVILLNSNRKLRLRSRFPSQLALLSYQSSLLKCRSVSEVQGVYFQTGIMIRVILRELWWGMRLHKGARCQKKATQTATGHKEGLVWNRTVWKTSPAPSTRSFLHVLDAPGCSNWIKTPWGGTGSFLFFAYCSFILTFNKRQQNQLIY